MQMTKSNGPNLRSWNNFEACKEASLLYTQVAFLPNPPVSDMTNGEKVANSASRTLAVRPLLLFFLAGVGGRQAGLPVGWGEGLKP